jgi:RNA polymerase sigma factor (sigma-70 family)
MSYDLSILKQSPANMDTFLSFKRGDEKAFNYLYHSLYKYIHFYAMRIVEDDFISDSIAQESFLKLWAYRDRMQTMMHALRFLRMITRWECLSYLKRPGSKFHRKTHFIEYAENTLLVSYDMEYEEEQRLNTLHSSEMVDAIHNALKYLPNDKQTIMRLYLEHGYTPKEIGRYFNRHYSLVSTQKESTEDLKNMIVRVKLEVKQGDKTKCDTSYERHLNEIQAEVYKRRRTLNHSFDRICKELEMAYNEVVKIYIECDKILKEANYATKRSYSYKKNTTIGK